MEPPEYHERVHPELLDPVGVAMDLLALGETGDARDLLEHLLEVDEDYHEARVVLADSYHEEARKLLDRLAREFSLGKIPDTTSLRECVGLYEKSFGHLCRAVESAFREVINSGIITSNTRPR